MIADMALSLVVLNSFWCLTGLPVFMHYTRIGAREFQSFPSFLFLAEREVLGWLYWKFANSRIPKDPIRV
jgi:hypothetical protein